jgi:chromosome segregation ATPase
MTSSPRQLNSQQNRNNLSVIEPKQYEEALNQLEQEKENFNKLSKKAERSLKDLEFKLVDSDRSKNRLLDEIKNFENKLFSLRKLNSDLVGLHFRFFFPSLFLLFLDMHPLSNQVPLCSNRPKLNHNWLNEGLNEK